MIRDCLWDSLNLAPCRPPLGVELRAGFLGSIPGLALGLTTGALTADRAPTYGRAAMIQSATLGGAIAGALMQMAVRSGAGNEYTVREGLVSQKMLPTTSIDAGVGVMDNCLSKIDGTTTIGDTTYNLQRCRYEDTSILDLTPGTLIGLNIGLGAGLAAAYLQDQTKYGPTWKRVLLVDLAVGAGMLGGATIGCVANTSGCLDVNPTPTARAISARYALAGGALGLVGGILLTRHFDDEPQAPSTIASTLTLIPTPAPPGGSLPGLSVMAAF